MLPTLLAIFLFVLLMTVISVYGYRAYVRPSRIYDRVGGMADVTDQTETAVKPRDVVVRVFEQVGEQIPLSAGDLTVTRRDLVMAGFRSDGAIRIFYGIKVIFCVVTFCLALMLHRHVTDNPVLRIVFLVAMTGLGYYAPGYYLESLVKKRQQSLRLSLPDALDMMVVSVEAGLGLDQALQYVSREIEESHPALSDEVGLVGLEMRAGKRRA
jgi:tight adherence protein C